MSTPAAQPPQAKANNRVVRGRHTAPQDLEEKYTEAGDHVPFGSSVLADEWTTVGRRPPPVTSKPTHRPDSPRPAKRVWRPVPRPVYGPTASPADLKEARRVTAFRASLAKLAPPPVFEAPASPVSAPVVAPSDTRQVSERRRIKAARATKKSRRTPVQSARRLIHAAVREVTKEEASSPTSSFASDNPYSPLAQPETRGSGAVLVSKVAGTTHIDNNAGRLMTVRLKPYEIVGVNFVGFWKSTLGSTFTPASIGFHIAGPRFMVRLPEGMVESLGAFLVGRVPNMETYLACQAFCRALARPIDFPTPRAMEDCAIYAPYIAMTSRAQERESIVRKLQGSVYTESAMKCLKIGGLASAIMSMPVATAATAAGASAVVAAGGAFLAMTAAAVGTALVIRRGLHLFRPDENVPRSHPLLASVNSSAKPPEQHPNAVVTRLQLDKKAADAVRTDAARVTGIAVARQEPTVFAKNQDNTVSALQKRSAVLPAPFERDDRAAFTRWVLNNWHHLVGKSFKIHVPDTPEEWLVWVLDWVRNSHSTGHVKERYEVVARELASQGITSHSQLNPGQIFEWTKRDASVKLETVLKNADKSPRQILAATPQFVVLTAPFIKDLTGVVRKAWKPTGVRVYAPGVGSKRLAEAMTEHSWENMANLDFDGYDSSQGDQIADMEIAICKRYHAATAMIQLMEGNKNTHGASREGVKFKTPYVRNSGDPWTTLFNTVLNGCLLSYVYCMDHGCDVRDMRARFFAGGDDGALFYDGPRVDFATGLARLGLPATVKHVANLHEVEFLSCRLTHSQTGWNFVPMAGKTIAKLAYSVRATTPHKAKQIARGAAQSMYAASHACPPLRAYLDAVLRVTKDVKAEAPRDEPWKMTAQDSGEPNEETWMHLGDIYGWTPALQHELEASLSRIVEAGTIIESPALEVLIDRDTGRSDYLFPRLAEADAPAPRLVCIEPNPGPVRGVPGSPRSRHAIPREYKRSAEPRAAGLPVIPDPQPSITRAYTEPTYTTTADSAIEQPVDTIYVAEQPHGGEVHFSYRKPADDAADPRADLLFDPDTATLCTVTEPDSGSDYEEVLAQNCVRALGIVVATRVTRAMMTVLGMPSVDYDYDWAISGKQRNKRKHAENGNMPGTKKAKKGGTRKKSQKAEKRVVVYQPKRTPAVPKSINGPRSSMPGQVMNSRFDMTNYMRTLCDAERYPPVRLGGENMIPTALASFKGSYTYTTSAPITSVVVHPRLWKPFLVSTNSAATYQYNPVEMFSAAQKTQLAQIGASARVVSAKLKVYTLAAATGDAGMINVGVCPRDDGFWAVDSQFSGVGLPLLENTVSSGGFPIADTPATDSQIVSTGVYYYSARQGAPEFQTYDFTDDVPLKDGAAAFWLPEDPQTMTFAPDRLRQTLVAAGAAPAINHTPIMDPFFVVGILGAANATQIQFDLYLNLEYVVTSGASGLIDTQVGAMNSVQAFDVVKRVGAGARVQAQAGSETSWGDKFLGAGKSILKGGLGLASKFLFGSSDIGDAVASLF